MVHVCETLEDLKGKVDGQEKEHPGCFSWAEKPRWGQVLAEVYIMSSEVLRRPWKRDIE